MHVEVDKRKTKKNAKRPVNDAPLSKSRRAGGKKDRDGGKEVLTVDRSWSASSTRERVRSQRDGKWISQKSESTTLAHNAAADEINPAAITSSDRGGCHRRGGGRGFDDQER